MDIGQVDRDFIYILLNTHFPSLFLGIIFFCIVSTRAKDSPVKNTFKFVHSLVLIWIIGKILKTVSPTLTLRWLSNVLYYIGVLPLGAAFFLFSRALTGKRDTFRLKLVLYIPSIIFFIAIVTNPLHYLFYIDYDFLNDHFGPIFYAHFIVTYIYFIASIVTLIYSAIKNKKDKMKSLSLLIGALLPLIMNIQYVLRFIKPLFDLTPLVYNATVIILGIAAFSYDFFSFIPNVVSNSLNSLPGAITLNNNLYGMDKSIVTLSNKETKYDIKLKKSVVNIKRYIDINTVEHSTKLLEKNVSTIRNNNILLQLEIDKRVNLIKRKERLRLAGEVHDILGYSISSIICLLESCRFKQLTGEDYKEKISKALIISNKSVHELDKQFNHIKPTKWEDSFYRLLSEIELYDMEYDIIIPNSKSITEELYMISYKILKESLTNCIKYSRATAITISLQNALNIFHLHIIDNGVGCKTINQGTGLNNMERRVEEFSGDINFYSEPNIGFHISISIPINSIKKVIVGN